MQLKVRSEKEQHMRKKMCQYCIFLIHQYKFSSYYKAAFGITVERNHQDAGLVDVTSFRDLIILGRFLMYISVCIGMYVEAVISLYFPVANIRV